MLLDGRTVIVNGVGRGMGQHVALRAADEGANVVLAARSVDYLEEVAAEVAGRGTEYLVAPTDMCDPGACADLVEAATDRFGRIDGLVNNAYRGPRPHGFVDDDNLEDWRQCYEVNVLGTLTITQHVARRMLAQGGGGSIVMVATMAARTGLADQGGYGGSKGALLSEVRSLASELGPEGIRVNAVVPGWMWGPGVQIYCAYQAHVRGVSAEEVADEIAGRIPLRRIPTDEECAGAVLFLLSDLASAVTGQALDVNGGEYYG